jgi:hypothetical protein
LTASSLGAQVPPAAPASARRAPTAEAIVIAPTTRKVAT